jgi:hypothetical protein
LGSQPMQRLAKVWAKNEAQEVWENVREWTPTPQVNSHFGSWSPDGLSNFQKAIIGVKTHWIEEFLMSLESSWNVDVENGLS